MVINQILLYNPNRSIAKKYQSLNSSLLPPSSSYHFLMTMMVLSKDHLMFVPSFPSSAIICPPRTFYKSSGHWHGEFDTLYKNQTIWVLVIFPVFVMKLVMTIWMRECFLFSQWKICFANQTVTDIVFLGEECSTGNSFLLDDGKRLLP